MRPVWSLAITFFVLRAVVSSAQSSSPNAVITYVEGDAYVNGEPALRLRIVLSENTVITTAKGRAEILFGHGDKIFLDKDSSIRVNGNSKSEWSSSFPLHLATDSIRVQDRPC
jgi:hypothetical protein